MQIRTKTTPLTATALQNDIIARLQYDGWDAWRINTTGVHDFTTGRTRRIKATERGKADVWCCISGRLVCLEIKIGKDRQSDYQKSQQRRVIHAGGEYVIIKTQEDFLEWYSSFRLRWFVRENPKGQYKEHDEAE